MQRASAGRAVMRSKGPSKDRGDMFGISILLANRHLCFLVPRANVDLLVTFPLCCLGLRRLASLAQGLTWCVVFEGANVGILLFFTIVILGPQYYRYISRIEHCFTRQKHQSKQVHDKQTRDTCKEKVRRTRTFCWQPNPNHGRVVV